MIAQNLYTVLEGDDVGNRTLEATLDHDNKTYSKRKTRSYIWTKSKSKTKHRSTAGWRILVQWNDGSEQWVNLGRMKEAYPVQMAQYAASRGLLYEPAFHWWEPYALRKCDGVTFSVRMRSKKTTHKYGIQIPRSIAEAIRIDLENKNTL